MTKNPRAYFVGLAPPARAHMRRIRDTIRSAAPGSVEAISYGIPAVKVNGRVLVYYAAWKTHCSLYPITGPIQRAFAKELKRYETSKGTVRFPMNRPVPVALIKRLVKARMAEVQAKARR